MDLNPFAMVIARFRLIVAGLDHAFLAKLQRLLNIAGYTALQVDCERNLVALHVPLLQRQFALD